MYTVLHKLPKRAVGERSLMNGGACRHHFTPREGDYIMKQLACVFLVFHFGCVTGGLGCGYKGGEGHKQEVPVCTFLQQVPEINPQPEGKKVGR